MAIKLDMSKAYDRENGVSWKHMDASCYVMYLNNELCCDCEWYSDEADFSN
jgi:hypothetical protein